MFDEIAKIREDAKIETLVRAHNLGDTTALDELDSTTVKAIQNLIRAQYGDTIKLFHGSEIELNNDIEWRENSSFTNEFDIEFAGEDGYIVEAIIPVERIKFYLDEENEFVITAGKLNCTVFTVSEYFGLE